MELNMFNYLTKEPYTGKNFEILASVSEKFSRPHFLTFRQALKIGRAVKKGEHGVRLCRMVIVEDAKTKKKIKKPKGFTVFNIEQTEEIQKEAA